MQFLIHMYKVKGYFYLIFSLNTVDVFLTESVYLFNLIFVLFIIDLNDCNSVWSEKVGVKSFSVDHLILYCNIV